MKRLPRWLPALVLTGLCTCVPAGVFADSGETTRVTDEKQHACTIGGTHHFIAIFAQKEIFPIKPPEKKPDKPT